MAYRSQIPIGLFFFCSCCWPVTSLSAYMTTLMEGRPYVFCCLKWSPKSQSSPPSLPMDNTSKSLAALLRTSAPASFPSFWGTWSTLPHFEAWQGQPYAKEKGTCPFALVPSFLRATLGCEVNSLTGSFATIMRFWRWGNVIQHKKPASSMCS